MATEPTQRRLAAILSADAAGYSRLMGADDAATVATLKLHRHLLGTRVAAHGGRLVDEAGDGVLAEFPRGYLGRAEEAREAMAEALRISPGFRVETLRSFLPAAIVDRYLEGWRRAGWEETAP